MTVLPKLQLEVVEVSPIAHRQITAMVRREDGCQLEQVEVADYPPNPNGERLRGARLRANLNLGEAARLLELDVVTMSGLERGSHAFLLDGYEQAINLFEHEWMTRATVVSSRPLSMFKRPGDDVVYGPETLCPRCGQLAGSPQCHKRHL